MFVKLQSIKEHILRTSNYAPKIPGNYQDWLNNGAK